MNALARVGAFIATLVALSAAAAAVGASVGPLDAAAPRGHSKHAATGASHGSGHAAEDPVAGPPAGLQVSEDGYTFDLLRTAYRPAAARTLRFRILDDRAEVVTSFDLLHGKRLHLIVVRRDLDRFQHVHPEMAPDGTWSVEVDLADAGIYRAFADFRPAGADRGLTLGQDLSVSGNYAPQPLAAPATSAGVGPYEVRLAGRLVPGETSRLTLTVTHDGRPVTDLQPYLEAFGHLVALRDGDLAYLHVHPDGAPGDGTTEPGPEITFFAEVPSAGTYRLYLDFKHGDAVHTAAFTALAGDPDAPAASQPAHGTHTH